MTSQGKLIKDYRCPMLRKRFNGMNVPIFLFPIMLHVFREIIFPEFGSNLLDSNGAGSKGLKRISLKDARPRTTTHDHKRPPLGPSLIFHVREDVKSFL